MDPDREYHFAAAALAWAERDFPGCQSSLLIFLPTPCCRGTGKQAGAMGPRLPNRSLGPGAMTDAFSEDRLPWLRPSLPNRRAFHASQGNALAVVTAPYLHHSPLSFSLLIYFFSWYKFFFFSRLPLFPVFTRHLVLVVFRFPALNLVQ